MNQGTDPAINDSSRRIAWLVASALVVLVWLGDWSGPYGPLETREWCLRHFWPDKHAALYVITGAPGWAYGEVKSCGPVSDPGETLRKKGYAATDLLNCAGWFPENEYVTQERFAVTFREKGYDSQIWNCLKTADGIICN
jgi:hypothetical protein